ncbi:hypothetical protein LEMLEM_LOCUS11298 [Lemmus lemmus]
MCYRERGPEPSQEEMDTSFSQWGPGSRGSAGQDISCSVATCLSRQAGDLGSTSPQTMAARGCRSQRIHTGGQRKCCPSQPAVQAHHTGPAPHLPWLHKALRAGGGAMVQATTACPRRPAPVPCCPAAGRRHCLHWPSLPHRWPLQPCRWPSAPQRWPLQLLPLALGTPTLALAALPLGLAAAAANGPHRRRWFWPLLPLTLSPPLLALAASIAAAARTKIKPDVFQSD